MAYNAWSCHLLPAIHAYYPASSVLQVLYWHGTLRWTTVCVFHNHAGLYAVSVRLCYVAFGFLLCFVPAFPILLYELWNSLYLLSIFCLSGLPGWILLYSLWSWAWFLASLMPLNIPARLYALVWAGIAPGCCLSSAYAQRALYNVCSNCTAAAALPLRFASARTLLLLLCRWRRACCASANLYFRCWNGAYRRLRIFVPAHACRLPAMPRAELCSLGAIPYGFLFLSYMVEGYWISSSLSVLDPIAWAADATTQPVLVPAFSAQAKALMPFYITTSFCGLFHHGVL